MDRNPPKYPCFYRFCYACVTYSELKEAIISIVAILNKHQQGELYFGIGNDGTVVGQTIGEKTIRDISKAISDFIEPKIYPEKPNSSRQQYVTTLKGLESLE